MDIYEHFQHVTKQEAGRLAAERQPTLTHIVEDTSHRTRVFRAICGAPIHARELDTRTSCEPTCQVCKKEWDDFNSDDPFGVDGDAA